MQIFKLNKNEIAKLKNKAILSQKKRSRISAHKNLKENLHEMFVCLHKDTYVPPHFHKTKTESYHLIEGEVDVYIFNKNGKIKKKIKLSSKSRSKNFYLRLGKKLYHTLVPKTRFVIFHEVTNGPFIKKKNKQDQMKIFSKKKFTPK